MEILAKVERSNDFGLRSKFRWTGNPEKTELRTRIVTDPSEKSFVTSKVFKPNATITRVENPYLWGRYVLRYEELNANENCTLVSERIVIHATTHSNAMSIAADNFDWRRVHRARFGRGVSFSDSAHYAHKYASNKGSYIIAGILAGDVTEGNYCTVVPPVGYDTTTDARGFVFVKYYDDDFYPYYIVE